MNLVRIAGEQGKPGIISFRYRASQPTAINVSHFKILEKASFPSGFYGHTHFLLCRMLPGLYHKHRGMKREEQDCHSWPFSFLFSFALADLDPFPVSGYGAGALEGKPSGMSRAL